MNNALRNIAELCRHEYLRERRSMHFTRNIIIWSLKLVLWTSMALALPRTLEATGISIGESLPFLLLTDQILRWFSQSTPAYNTQQYRLDFIIVDKIRCAGHHHIQGEHDREQVEAGLFLMDQLGNKLRAVGNFKTTSFRR